MVVAFRRDEVHGQMQKNDIASVDQQKVHDLQEGVRLKQNVAVHRASCIPQARRQASPYEAQRFVHYGVLAASQKRHTASPGGVAAHPNDDEADNE